MDATHIVSDQDSLPPLPPIQSFVPTAMPYDHHQRPHPQQVAKQSRCLIMEFHKERFQRFWQQQMFDVLNLIDVKQHTLPLTRIKRIMKADPEVKMISAETPYLFSRACEMLVLDLTLRSWLHAEDCNRRTLQKGDILTAMDHSADMDFLLYVLPKEPMETCSNLVRSYVQDEVACDFYTGNDAAMYPHAVMNLPPFVHQPTSYEPNPNLQAGHALEPENITPFMVQPSLASDQLMYDPPKDNVDMEEIVMSLMEAQPTLLASQCMTL